MRHRPQALSGSRHPERCAERLSAPASEHHLPQYSPRHKNRLLGSGPSSRLFSSFTVQRLTHSVCGCFRWIGWLRPPGEMPASHFLVDDSLAIWHLCCPFEFQRCTLQILHYLSVRLASKRCGPYSVYPTCRQCNGQGLSSEILIRRQQASTNCVDLCMLIPWRSEGPED